MAPIHLAQQVRDRIGLIPTQARLTASTHFFQDDNQVGLIAMAELMNDRAGTAAAC